MKRGRSTWLGSILLSQGTVANPLSPGLDSLMGTGVYMGLVYDVEVEELDGSNRRVGLSRVTAEHAVVNAEGKLVSADSLSVGGLIKTGQNGVVKISKISTSYYVGPKVHFIDVRPKKSDYNDLNSRVYSLTPNGVLSGVSQFYENENLLETVKDI